MTPEINYLTNPVKDSPKRVLFVITQSEIGGAQQFLHMLVSRLDKDKYNILVAAGPNFNTKFPVSDIKNDLLDLLEKEGIKTIRLKYLSRDVSPWHDLLASWELKRIIKNWEPDTIFLNSSKAGFIGSFVSKFLIHNSKLKVIYRIGGWTFNDPWPNWKKKFWIFLEKLSAKWKDIIIVNNKHDLDQAKQLRIKPKQNLVLVYNGLDVYRTEFLPKEEARLRLFKKLSRQAGKIFQTDIIVGTVANFYPAKGLIHLIEAAEHFKNKGNLTFFVLGDGQDRLILENLIEKRGLQKKVFLLGQVLNAHKLLSAFDIFVLPSVKEGFPWAVLEAMAAKLPVIATKVGAIPEMIEDGKNGFIVEPGHPEQIVSKIQELLNKGHLRQELGIQAHQTVLFKFSSEKMVQEIEALL